MNFFIRIWPYLLALSAVGISLLSTTKFGIGISPDSISYLSGGKNLLEHGHIVDNQHNYITLWPPLPAIIVSLFLFLNVKPEIGLLILNAIMNGVVVCLSAHLLSKMLVDKLIYLIGGLLLVSCFPSLKISIMAWSEPLFTALLFSGLILTWRYIASPNKQLLVLTAIIIGLAAVQRYIGVSLILFCGSYLAIKERKSGKIPYNAFLFGLIALIPISLWGLRNYLIEGCLFGCRNSSTSGAADQLLPALQSIGRVIWPLIINHEIQILVAILIIVGIIVFVSIAVIRKEWFTQIVFLLSYALFYLAFLFYVLRGIQNEAISVRYIAPIAPLIVLAILMFLDFICKNSKGLAKKTVYTGLLGWVLASVISTFQLVNVWRNFGAGDYSTVEWYESSIFSLLKGVDKTTLLYSNAADFLEYQNIQNSFSLPKNAEEDVSKFVKKLPKDKAVLFIWFNKGFRKYLASPQLLQAAIDLRVVYESNEGLILGNRPLMY